MKKKTASILAVLIAFQFVAMPLAQAQETKADKGGCMACIVGVFIGSRAGYQWNEGTPVRLYEVLMYVPLLNLVLWVMDMINIYGGTTWTEITQKQTLLSSHYDAWHNYAALD